VSRLLLSDVRLERDGKNLHIRVAAAAAGADAKPPAPDPVMAEAAPLRTALKRLLDAHRSSRQVMRHLGYFERALATQGLKAMSEVRVDVLSASLRQLESIVTDWSDDHLAALRSKMAVAVMDRSNDPFQLSIRGQLSNFDTESRLLVGDVSHSVFIELERQYQGLVEQETIQASLAAAKNPT